MLKLSRTTINVTKRLSSTITAPKNVGSKHPISNFFIKLSLATGAFYVGGVALSEYNDQFGSLFTDNVPLAEEACELYESFRDGELFNGSANGSAIHSTAYETFEDLKNKIGKLGSKEIPSGSGVSPQPLVDQNELSEVSAAAATVPANIIPLSLKQLVSNTPANNEVVGQLLKVTNETIDVINRGGFKLPEKDVNELNKQLNILNDIVSKSNVQLNKLADQSIITTSNVLQQEYNEKLVKEQALLDQKYLHEFNNFKEKLEAKFQKQLKTELTTNEENLSAKQANQVALLSIKQVEQFNRILKEKLDQEREGRLSKLEQLDAAVSTLDGTITKLDKYVLTREAVTQLVTLCSQLKDNLILGSGGDDLVKHVEKIKLLASVIPYASMCGCKNCKKSGFCSCGCSRKKKLMDYAASELETVLTSTPDVPVLTNEQLYNRWNLLSDKLKEASLLPPNAGILGHFGAKIFSKLLFDKTGISKDNDMENVVACVSEYIKLAKLDLAVEEVVSLDGWARVLCNDWIIEARKKLEVQTLVDVIYGEARTT
ncbi:related to Formation of crista junctions protein 1 [Saccharomycodes ludwigii]|uniref:MICOS complex subunit MIC60 n=1 Tax=Saccharomycodes ludwigii TaxID=36035 RepID=A0A376B7Q9_9ASCO|nr:hypothetical protein SCDLUD_003595 [Saccharomycodes ludwigii]KAH3900603.1 hypothetical protein SCDLUD_003595 [Saccharomycodes ludwigii]SSD60160.1 related to Formation of crista junctions protein 1 [Saccharomycodes ludwigii]